MAKQQTDEISKQSAQEIQDEIFRRMSAEQKIGLMRDLWRLAREITSHTSYDSSRPRAAPREHRSNT